MEAASKPTRMYIRRLLEHESGVFLLHSNSKKLQYQSLNDEIIFKENTNKPLFTESVDNFVNNMKKINVEPVIY